MSETTIPVPDDTPPQDPTQDAVDGTQDPEATEVDA